MSWTLRLQSHRLRQKKWLKRWKTAKSCAALNGLRVLNVGGSFFINSERLESCAPQAADALCRYTELDKTHFGEALQNPAFVAELTELINQGYWFFDE